MEEVDQKKFYDQIVWQEQTLWREIIALREEINKRCESCGKRKLATLGTCVHCSSQIEVVGSIS